MKYGDKGGIYKITNKVNGKIWIGSAVSFKRRWRLHNRQWKDGWNSPHLQRAWEKYGEENFVFEEVEVVKDREILLEREQHWLDETKSYERQVGYNIAKIAGSALGVRCSEEKKRKISQKLMGRKLSEETKQKMRESWTDEKRKHHSDLNKGKSPSEETREKMRQASLGRTHSQETIEKCREVKLGSQNPMSKLTEDDVRSIRRRFAEGGITQAALGTEYGLAQPQVSYIINRKAWAHVE